MTLSSRGLARSRDKLKPWYIHYHRAYEYQAWQDGNLKWPASIHKVIGPFAHLVLLITWQTKAIMCLLPQYLWSPKLAVVVTYHEKSPLIKLHGPSIMWFCEVTRQITNYISPLTLGQWLPSMVRWWLTVGASTEKSTYPFNHAGT